MTNLPPKGNADSMDNVAVTREEFRQDIGEFLEFSAQALGNVSGTYTTEAIDPLAVVLQGAPTLAAGAEPGAADSSLRLANTRWVKQNGADPASETVAGIAEIATQAEVDAGTDDQRIVTPLKLANSYVAAAGDTMTGDLTVPNLVSTGDVQAASLNGGQLAGFRNWIINGNFSVNQRGGTRTPGVGIYGFDRWKGHASGLEQVVEALPAGQYTLSWTGGGNGTIGGTTAVSPITATVTAGDTSVIVPATADLVQLESGPVATPFEYRPIVTELALCQRYFARRPYTVGGAQVFAGQVLYFPFLHPVPLRVSPTSTRVGQGTTGGMNGQPGFVAGPLDFYFETSAFSALNTNGTAFGDMYFDAEL